MSTGFYGRHEHSVDVKGRVFVPVKYRDKLGSEFMAAAVLDHCISLYPRDEWEKLMQGIYDQPVAKARHMQRTLSSKALEVELDSHGRILLPKHLMEYAFLEKDVIIIGAGNHAEIWNPDRLAEEESAMTDEAMEEIFAELGF